MSNEYLDHFNQPPAGLARFTSNDAEPEVPEPVELDVALAGLPGHIRPIAERLSAIDGGLLAVHLHPLSSIRVEGSYANGLRDGVLRGLALGIISSAFVRDELSEEEADTLRAFAMNATEA